MNTKIYLIVFALVLMMCGLAHAGKVGKNCQYNGKKLYGKVQLVKAFPDIKVKVVTAFPDLKVQKVSAFADSCGKWEMVSSFPDIKVQIVDSFPDITIEYVTAFPGVP